MPFARPLVLFIVTTVFFFAACHSDSKHQVAQVQVSDDSHQAQLLNQKGIESLSAGNLDKAQRFFEQSIAADQGFGPAHNNLGKVFLAKKQLYEAAWEFEYAAKLMPGRAEPENNLALVYERAGKLDQAITHYEKSHSLAPDQTEVLGNLVRARIRRGDRDNSLKELLGQLVLQETRKEWAGWAKEKLATIFGVQADPSHRDDLPKPEPANILIPFKREGSP